MRPEKYNLTIERLKEILSFDSETGIFTRINGRRGRNDGVGHIEARTGYRAIMIDRFRFYAQQLAWFWVNGTWPRIIRFQNGNKDDCRIENLGERLRTTKHDFSTKEGRSAHQLEYRSIRRKEFSHKEIERKFGLSLADYSALVALQDNKCAICNCAETATRNGRVKALAVDHDHETGEIRGLLCVACNTGIGKFKDNRNTMLAAIKYLDKHSGVERVAAKLEVVRNA
jgi:Recombination endonuclease VII/HNH endonuclease